MSEPHGALGVLFGEPDSQTAGEAAAPEQPEQPKQHRLTRIQLVNWGTFSGHHSLPVPRKGLLITGPSGSGKSSLLDAISVVLVPPRWLDLNAAARDAASRGKDRTVLSYMRGAWSRNTNEESGELATQLLRRGAVWSAIGLTYDDGHGGTTTLVRAFSATRATTSVDGVTKVSLVVDGDLDLRNLEEVAQAGLNLRTVKTVLRPAFATTDYSAFADKLTRRLGISGDHALRLLHKTQSAKGLTHLDGLLRDFMLDEPATFAAAHRTVEQFEELREAWVAVQEATQQVEHLTPLRGLHAALQEADTALETLAAQSDALGTYAAERAVMILEREILRSREEISERSAEAERLAGEAERTAQALSALQGEYARAGGSQVQLWRREAASAEKDRADRERRRVRYVEQLTVLGAPVPTTEAEHVALVGQAREEAEQLVAEREATGARRDDARDVVRAIGAQISENIAQLRTLANQPSNLDRHDVTLRDVMAAAVGVSPRRLPFVAELLQVRAEDVAWQGAIERLLGGFARTVLVPDALYAKVADYVDATHLGRKLLYNRVPVSVSQSPRPVGPTSVVHKLEVAQTDLAPWLNLELSRRFDMACAETLADFRAADQALTINGQIKRSGNRHEKDDRSRVDDRRTWVLGFDNQAKQDLFHAEIVRLNAELASAERTQKAVDAEVAEGDRRGEACRRLADTVWDDVDTRGPTLRIDDLQRQIESFTQDNTSLRDLDERIRSAAETAQTAREHAADALGAVRGAESEATRLAGLLADRRNRLRDLDPVPQDVRALLDARFFAQARALTSATIDDVSATAGRGITSELGETSRRRDRVSTDAQRRISEFAGRWAVATGVARTSVEDLPEYLRLLEELEVDGLPRYLDRFQALLDEQSTTNLTQLLHLMTQEAKTIRQRIQPVNESLSTVEFNPGTHLKLVPRDRSVPEVRDFRSDVHAVLDDSLGAGEGDPVTAAAARYERLHRLVSRLGSSAPADRAWRELVLDVRRHVEFRGEERTADGVVVEVHTSGEGRSGGQRVKLVTFALAAALRYQLGGRTGGLPSYGTVVIDEAFDKADAQFTAVSMRVFETFGFQMVLATPLKMVQTLSEFIGGAALVSIRDRKHSLLQHVELTELV